MRAGRALALAALAGLAAGCGRDQPVAAHSNELPGFDPCRIEYDPDRRYSLCPVGDFPYGEQLTGRLVIDWPEPGDELFVDEATGDEWAIQWDAHFTYDVLFFAGFSSPQEADLVQLVVDAPCDERDDHAFVVHDAATGQLIVASGTSASRAISGMSVAATEATDRCAAAALDGCACWQECAARPMRFELPEGWAELWPSERTRLGDYHALLIEGWQGSGEATCEDAPEAGQRWLIHRDRSAVLLR